MKRKYNAKEFRIFMDNLGLNQTETGRLLNRSTRSICFYANGQRSIPKEIWLELEKLAAIPKLKLWKKLQKPAV